MLRFLWSLYRAIPPGLRVYTTYGASVLRFMLKPFVRSVRIGGYRMELDLSDNAALRYLRWRDDYEKGTRELFLTLVARQAGCVVVDVGASYGTYTLGAAHLARYCDVARIFAIEPDRRCAGALARSVAVNRFDAHVQVVHAVAGDRAGTATLIQSANASTSNRSFASKPSEGSFFHSRGEVIVDAVILDDVLGSATPGQGQPVVVKIDVEGNEARVFRGLQRTLAAASDMALIFEFYPAGMLEVGEPVETLVDALAGVGIEHAWVREGTETREIGNAEALDAFVRTFYAENTKRHIALDIIAVKGATPNRIVSGFVAAERA